jgi:hypothetical protein
MPPTYDTERNLRAVCETVLSNGAGYIFPYSPLLQGQFRLLTPVNSDGTSFTIDAVDMLECPDYVALSYTWGRAAYKKGRPESEEYSILLNSITFAIQQNLHDALRCLAEDLRKRKVRLWVDAICINQEDLMERSVQVLKMKDIYEKATDVHCWLGLPFDYEETEKAINLMRELNQILHRGLQDHDQDLYAVSATIDDTHHVFPNPGSEAYTAWTGIRELFQQAYWQRAWIYQEATGPSPTTWYSWTYSFDDILLSATLYFARVFTRYAIFDRSFAAVIGFGGSVAAMNDFRLSREDQKPKNVLELLTSIRRTRSTDPRDKVYAVRGLANDLSETDLVPDYSKSIKEVYQDVVQFALSSVNNGLDVLGYAFHPAPDATNHFLSDIQQPRLPSWMPDWRQRVTITPFSETSNARGFVRQSCYTPAKDTVMNAKIVDEALVLQGFFIDTVSRVTSICETDPNLSNFHEGMGILPVAEVYLDGSPMQEAFARTLAGDRAPIRQHRISRNSEAPPLSLSNLSDAEQRQEGEEIDLYIHRTCFGRRFGLTHGGYMAILPAATQTNDIVALFHGGRTLFVIRPVEGGHDFVGECYVHGLMHGEAFSSKFPHHQQPQMFSLI